MGTESKTIETRPFSVQGNSISSSVDVKEVTRPAAGPGDKGSKGQNAELGERQQERHLQYLFAVFLVHTTFLLNLYVS